MNILKKLVVAAVLVFVQAYAVSASASLGYMRISLIENELQIMTAEAGEWGYAAINTPLDVGDQVWVPAGGRAELQLNTGTYIRLDGNTALQILSIDEDSSQFYLSLGNVYIYYDAPRGSVIQVDTPDASTRAFERAIFSLGISPQYTDVVVYKGYVLTENRIGEIRVNAGNMVSLGPDTNGEIASIGYLTDWERWNQARDEGLYGVRESQSVRYLPPELTTYYSDFDSYGSWVHVNDYGYVWRPQHYIDASWTPYRHGRWMWRGGDYIWIAYEPWGWAPYHYGRWAYAGGVGWCWVPPLPGSVYWGPGYVGWIRTDDYVAWVPLAPGEIYYGRGYYGRNSVNITNVNINEIHFTNIYQNVTVNNGPIVVDQRSFHKGSQTIVNLDKNIHDRVFTQKNMIPGPPADGKPAKKRLFAVDREIPRDKLPPQHVKVRPVTEMTKTRRLLREQDKSVFNPDTKPANLPTKKADMERLQGKRAPKLEKIQPMKGEQLKQRPLPAGPESVRRGKGEQEQVQPGQQGRPLGPPEEGRGGKKRIEQPQPVQREQLERRPLPAGPESVRGGKGGQEQVQPGQQGRPPGPPEEGRGGKKRIEQPQPVQREQLERRPLPAGPESVRGGKGGQEQVQPGQQGRPPGPPEEGRGGKKRIEQPQPVQREQLEQRPLPAGPENVRGGKDRQEQVSPPRQGRPVVPPKGKESIKKVEPTRPVAPEQLERRPLPAGPESVRGGKGGQEQVPPPEQGRPMVPPKGKETIRKVEPTRPVPPEQLEQRPLPAGPAKVRGGGQPLPPQQGNPMVSPEKKSRESVRRVEPPPPVQQKRPAPQPAPAEPAKKQGAVKQPPVDPLCGPGQKNQYNQEACPQNFPQNIPPNIQKNNKQMKGGR